MMKLLPIVLAALSCVAFGQEPKNPAQSSDPPQRIYKVGKDVSAPQIVDAPDPEYSEDARKRGVEGRCVLRLIVDQTGRPHDIKVIKCIGYGLQEKAVEALRKWRFKPARLNGLPVPVEINVEVNFNLYKQSAENKQAATPPSSPGIYTVGNGVTAPKPITQVDPEYSDEARRKHISGTVRLMIVVEPDGAVSNIKVTQALGYGLDEKAIEAVRKWRFEPAKKDGLPVRVPIFVEMSFHPY